MPPGGKVILFADDNADDRFLMLTAAKEAGIEEPIVSVAGGNEVIAYLEKWPAGQDAQTGGTPQLAILDLMMPKMNGFETLQWIRGDQRWGALPVLILSASTQPGDKQKAHLMGANAFLTKPIRVNELVEMVAAIKNFWLRFTDFQPGPP